ncbi:MAG: cysteine desulfurase [Lachnospiraceae bacterium]|nr:cysteine desulfurase [Lachnospiraceae bacterium]
MNIYVDNAATTKVSETAITAMLPYFNQIYGNPSSLHSAGQLAAESLLMARETIANVFGCSPKEIIFTSGGSEANNQALLSAAEIGKKKNKKHIISSTIEHHSILHTLEKLKKQGFEITLLNAHKNGIIHPDELIASIRPDTIFVTIMYANNEIGSIQPIAELGKICQEHGILFHTDAVQAAGHIKIHVKKENIDMLSLSAHKFHGPKGIGILYAKHGIPLTNLIEGGAQERGKRAGTENLPAIIGMAAALQEAAEHIDKTAAKLIPLRDRLIEGLTEIPHTVLNGDPIQRLPNNVHVCFEGIEGESLLLLLNNKGIYASSGSACTSGSLDPSHVLLAIGQPHEIAHGSLRLSLSEENTIEEVESIIKITKESVTYLRGMSPIWKDLQEGKRNYVI